MASGIYTKMDAAGWQGWNVKYDIADGAVFHNYEIIQYHGTVNTNMVTSLNCRPRQC